MAAMRVVQPKQKAIQERYKDDRVQMQQEVMKLYKEEKVNPMAGCLPIVLQIPIFYALYKVLLLAVEMRHQPFALWLHDLSAPDPLTPVNLFGVLDFQPPSIIAIGILMTLNWRLALMAMTVIPGAMAISFVSSRRIRPIYRVVRKDVEEIDVVAEQLAQSEHVDEETLEAAIERAQDIDKTARQRGMGGDLLT